MNRNDGAIKHTIDSIFYKDFIFQTRLNFIALFPGGSVVRTLPAMKEPQEMWVWSPGWEDPLEEGMATHSSVLAWRIPWTEASGGLQSIGSQRVGHNWSDLAHTHTLNCRDGDFLYTLPQHMHSLTPYQQPPLDGSFVQWVNLRWHTIITRSPAFILGLTRHYTFYRFGQKHSDTYPLL